MTKRTRRQVLRLSALAAATGVAGCASLSATGDGESDPTETPTGQSPTDGPTDTPTDTRTPAADLVDDWQYSPGDLGRGNGGGGGTGTATQAPSATMAQSGASRASSEVGLAAGGAKDVNTFRRNIEEGYLPIPSSLSYEGLFYDYYFDTGGGSCASTFCPAYAPGVSEDPLAPETERYFTVGLDSGLSQSEFSRKKLNLVVVLDVSGSMSSSFDEYYYDRYGNKQEVENYTGRPKIEVAKDALASLTEQLRPGDRFGVVLYNDSSTVAKPLNPVADTDMDAIRGHIEEDVKAGGGTRLSAGIDDATDLLSEYAGADQTEWENRMIVLTDAMPNLGETSEGGLEQTLRENAADTLHTTFVGVGVDFNTEIVDGITSIEGANYYSVHSADEFETRLGEEFEYMVTPLVYDLNLSLDAPDASVAAVYGSTAAEDSTADIVKVNTLFPSPKREGRAKGGIVLVKVADGAGADIDLTASWETRDGRTHERTETVSIPDESPHYGNSGVRKGILLTRYADLMKAWMIAEREGDDAVPVSENEGIEHPDDSYDGRWEQESEPLTVSPTYRQRFGRFATYFEREMRALGDDSLEQELEILRKLADYDG